MAFSLTFDLPAVWFLLPPPDADDYELAATGRSVQLLATLVLGRDDQLNDLKARMEELREADPRSSGDVLAEAGGFPPELSWEHFQRSREEALFALVEEETSEIERMMGDLRRVLARFDDLSHRSHYASHPRTVYQAISHSLIGEAVFDKVLQTFDPADDGRYTLLRSRIPSPEAIEAAIDLDDPQIVERLAAVYDRAEELLQERLARRGPVAAAAGQRLGDVIARSAPVPSDQSAWRQMNSDLPGRFRRSTRVRGVEQSVAGGTGVSRTHGPGGGRRGR